MLDKTRIKRTKTCEGCKKLYVVNQKVSLTKSRYCSQKCFLSKITRTQRVAMAKKASTHGMYATRIYRIWGAMKQRCTNPNAYAYTRYGGSGITIDPTWYTFEGFYKDMSEGYKDGLTLDRTDGTKGYNKDNCRWATRREQSSNLKNNVFVEFEGEVFCAAELARKLGVNRTTISAWIYKGKLKRVWK